MNRTGQRYIGNQVWRQCARALALLVILSAVFTSSAAAQGRQGDRLGIRFGVWPQSSIDARLGFSDVTMHNDVTGIDEQVRVDMRIIEPGAVAPYLELFGEFHLKGIWWLEGSIGYGVRPGVELAGLNDSTIRRITGNNTDRLLLAKGRVDFFPLFGGIRMKHVIGSPLKPHNLFARAGLSLIIASESPSQSIHPDILPLYSPGSEGAPGFLIGGGSEYFFSEQWAATVDVSYRYSKFSYGPQAEFDLSSIWVALGMVVRIG